MSKIADKISSRIVSHPGETLKEVLESNNMTQKELSARIGISSKYINQTISGLSPITKDVALKLESALPLSATRVRQ